MYPNKHDVVETLYDEACLIIQDENDCSYLTALVLVTNIISGKTNNDFNNSRLSDILQLLILEEDLELLTSIYIKLMSKGFQYEDIPIDILLPEGVGYLMGYLISGLYYNKYNLNILDINLKAGVLLFAISRFLEHKEIKSSGIESNDILNQLADALFNLNYQNLNTKVDADKFVQGEQYDLLVGNLDHISVTFDKITPTIEIITKYLPLLKEEHYFVFIVDKELILSEQFITFKESVSTSSILKSILILPEDLFIDAKHQKCILVGQKVVDSSNEVIMVNLPKITPDDGLEKVIETINQLLYELTKEEKNE